MALTSWPTPPPPWTDDWLIWRFEGSKRSRPVGVPDNLAPYPFTGELLAWMTWKRKGARTERPDVTLNIPDWANPLLKQLNAAVPVALPDVPESWVLAWAITRFRNDPPPSTVPPQYSIRYPYVWSFLRWAGWQRKGAPLPRPENVPKRVPLWAWQHLEKLNQAVPKDPPPPPPPPPPEWTNSWTLPNPIAWTTWGWLTDSDFRDTNITLQRMKDAGVKTVALQIGQFTPDVPDRCRAFGFKVALWGSPDSNDQVALDAAKADGYCPQIEGPYEYASARNNFEAGFGAGKSRSIVTTLAGVQTFIEVDGRITTVEAEELKRLGVTHAWVETYKQGGSSHFPISKMMYGAEHRGIPYANPLLGLYSTEAIPNPSISDYRPPEDPNSLDSFGRQVGVYTAETMSAVNWSELKALGQARTVRTINKLWYCMLGARR